MYSHWLSVYKVIWRVCKYDDLAWRRSVQTANVTLVKTETLCYFGQNDLTETSSPLLLQVEAIIMFANEVYGCDQDNLGISSSSTLSSSSAVPTTCMAGVIMIIRAVNTRQGVFLRWSSSDTVRWSKLLIRLDRTIVVLVIIIIFNICLIITIVIIIFNIVLITICAAFNLDNED